jgi:hypothetical protein
MRLRCDDFGVGHRSRCCFCSQLDIAFFGSAAAINNRVTFLPPVAISNAHSLWGAEANTEQLPVRSKRLASRTHSGPPAKLPSPSRSANCNQALGILAKLLCSLLNGSAGIRSLDPAHQLRRATSDQIIHKPIMQCRGLRLVCRWHQWPARHRSHTLRSPHLRKARSLRHRQFQVEQRFDEKPGEEDCRKFH